MTVTGRGFTHVRAVEFGAARGSKLKVLSGRKLAVTAPKHAAGQVRVKVVTARGSSKPVRADRFTYAVAPGRVTAAGVLAATPTSLRLAWTNPSGRSFTGVRIREAAGSKPPASPAAGKAVTTTGKTVNRYTVRKLAAGRTYSFALFARGAHGVTAKADTLTAKTNRKLAVTTGSLPQGTGGRSYLAAVKAVGGVGPYKWTATGLPKGLTLSGAGVITGFPAGTGTSKVKLRVIDAAHATATATLSLAVPKALPAQCDDESCSVVTPDGATVQVPAADIVSVTRGSTGAVTSAVLTGISVTADDVLVLAATTSLPTGLIAVVGTVTSNGDGTSTVTLTPGTVGDGYASGTVQALGTATTQTTTVPARSGRPGGGRGRRAGTAGSASTAAALTCDGGVTSSLHGLDVTDQFAPTVTAIWKHPLFGAGGFYPGPGGLQTFFASLDGSVTVNMGVTVSGKATCTLNLPSADVPFPAGDLGKIDLGVDPSLTFKVNGRIDVRATATLKCGAYYEWTSTGGNSGGRYCIPSYTPPQLSAPGSIDASLAGNLDVSLTLDDTTGVQGSIDNTLHLGYYPGQHPDAELDVTSDWDIKGVLAKWWKDGPTVNIASGTILDHKTLWSSDTPPSQIPPGTMVWNNAAKVAGTDAAVIGSMSCASAENCAAAGSDAAGDALVADQVNGTWHKAINVPGEGSPGGGNAAAAVSVSCATAGNCAVGGYSGNGAQDKAFVADEVHGTWHTAIKVPGTDNAEVSSVSCAAAGDCVAGGYFAGSGQAFVATETSGTWHDAIEVPGTGALNVNDARVESVSCASVGNCSLGGFYTDKSGNQQAFVATEVSGTWHNAIEVPGTGALNYHGGARVESVSCASPGNCTAGGSVATMNAQQAFVADEIDGTWHDAIVIPGLDALNKAGLAGVASVSCPSPGNCAAGGYYFDGNSDSQAYVADEVNGTWHTAIKVPGTPALSGDQAQTDSVSCESAGNCLAVGFDSSRPLDHEAFAAAEANGTWKSAITVPGTAALNSGHFAEAEAVACAPTGSYYCALGGMYTDGSDHQQAFVAGESDAP